VGGQPFCALRQDELPLRGRTTGTAPALPELDPRRRRKAMTRTLTPNNAHQLGELLTAIEARPLKPFLDVGSDP